MARKRGCRFGARKHGRCPACAERIADDAPLDKHRNEGVGIIAL